MVGNGSVAGDLKRLALSLLAQLRDRLLQHVATSGAQGNPCPFRQACRRFIYSENLLPEAPAAGREANAGGKALQAPSKSVPILRKAIAQIDDEGGWVRLATVGHRLADLAPDFDSRTYGFAKLSDLVAKTGAFDIDRPEEGGVNIRLKSPRRGRTAKAKPN